jgi:hypothetical protein
MSFVELTLTDGHTKIWVNPTQVSLVIVNTVTGKTGLAFSAKFPMETGNELAVNESLRETVDALNRGMR